MPNHDTSTDRLLARAERDALTEYDAGNTGEGGRAETEWVVWCHLHRHYVLTVDGPAPTWTPVPADARTMTRAEAHALANGREWLGHEATPWARAKGNP